MPNKIGWWAYLGLHRVTDAVTRSAWSGNRVSGRWTGSEATLRGCLDGESVQRTVQCVPNAAWWSRMGLCGWGRTGGSEVMLVSIWYWYQMKPGFTRW